MSTTVKFTRFTGIGPIAIPAESRLSNQQEIIDSLVSIIDQLSLSTPPASKNEASPHHVLSVLGARGSGKTSLLLTVIRQLRQGGGNALTLDLLQADQLRESFPIVPAIVALVESYLDANSTPEFSKGFLLQYSLPLKKLAWATESSEMLHVLSRDTLNMADWNTKVFELIGQPTDLPAKFREWVSALLERTGKSVIVIPIDDADISVDKASEVIEAVRIYLSDPRIVTIVAADITSLERRIRNKRLAALPPVPELKADKKEDGAPEFLFGLSSAQFQSQEAVAEQEYVESLLTKVLPPATRHAIRPIPPSERVARPFYLPGQPDYQSLFELISTAESRLSQSASLASLLMRHPDLLSENLRIFANQYALIRGLCTSIRSGDAVGESWRDYLKAHYSAPTLSSRVDAGWMRIKDEAAFALSKLHAEILRSLLAGNEYRALEAGISVHQRVELRQMPTIHEMASATIEACVVSGVRSEPSGRRNIYRVLSRQINQRPSSSLVDFFMDFAYENGATVESVGEVLGFQFEGLTRIRYPVLQPMFQKLTSAMVAKLSPNLQIIANPQEKTIGGDLLVSASRERLAPVFIQNSLDLGIFVGNVPTETRHSHLETLMSIAEEFVELKGSEDRAGAIGKAFFKLVGALTLDAFLTLDAAMQTVVRETKDVPNRVAISWAPENAWILRGIEDFHETLSAVIGAEEISWERRFGLLSFLADLPFPLLHNATPSVRQEVCEGLRSSVGRFLDDLTEAGFLTKRRRGSIDLGIPQKSPNASVPDIFLDAYRRFPSISVTRRTQALQNLLRFVKTMSPTSTWDYRVQAPPTWQAMHDSIVASYRKHKTKPRKASK